MTFHIVCKKKSKIACLLSFPSSLTAGAIGCVTIMLQLAVGPEPWFNITASNTDQQFNKMGVIESK